MVISNTGHSSIHCNCHWVQPYMYTASTQFSKKSEKLALMPQSQVMHGAGGNGVTSCQKNEYFIYKLKSLASLKYVNFPSKVFMVPKHRSRQLTAANHVNDDNN